MTEKSSNTGLQIVLVAALIVLGFAIIWKVSSKPTSETAMDPGGKEAILHDHDHHDHDHTHHSHDHNHMHHTHDPIDHTHEITDSAVDQSSDADHQLNDIVRTARGWGPVFQEWYGKEAPDFILTDLQGKQHSLSQYRGKNVIVVFWASWCAPCKMEVPHLKEVKEAFGEEELKILAITVTSPINSERRIKDFVKDNNVNYTVLITDGTGVEPPFSQIRGIPTSFFIDPEGKIKLGTSGLISAEQMQEIVKAEAS